MAYEAAAEVLGVKAEDVSKNPALIKDNEKALEVAAEVFGMEPIMYGAVLDQILAQNAAPAEQMTDMQSKMLAGITAAAEELDMNATDLATDLGKIKANSKAMRAAVEASGLPQEILTMIINQQLANDEIALDKGIDFSVKNYRGCKFFCVF